MTPVGPVAVAGSGLAVKVTSKVGEDEVGELQPPSPATASRGKRVRTARLMAGPSLALKGSFFGGLQRPQSPTECGPAVPEVLKALQALSNGC
jgi:hypothetical protein